MSEIRADKLHNASGDNDSGIDLSTNDVVAVKTADTERMRVDASGHVGIGGTPNNFGGMTKSVEIKGTSDVELSLHATSDAMSDGARIGQIVFNAGSDATVPTVSAIKGSVSGTDENKGILSFHTRNTDTGGLPDERMRVTQNGNLAIGTTTEFARLHVTAQGDVTTPGLFEDTRTGSTSTTCIVIKRNGSNVGAINTTNTSTAYVTSSDHRLKENVTADWNATTRLKQLNPVRFNFIADADTTVDGFLAHEVQSVVPEAITGTHNEVDDDGNPVYQGIDQSKLVPLLVKTIQELEARITALESE